MAARRQISVALPRQVQLPAGLENLLEQFLAGLLGGAATVAAPPAPPAPIGASGTFRQVGTGPSGCWCLKWVEDTLGYGGHYRGTGYETAELARESWSALGFAVSDPQVGDFVTFAPATSNGGAGHIGIISGHGTFTSLWCDGRVMDGPISTFAHNNGAPVSAYLRVPHP